MRKLILAAGLLTTQVWANDCGAPAVTIEQIQGRGAESEWQGKSVQIEATVTAVFQGAEEMSGYFVQQPDRDARASHGLFVYARDPVTPGDHLRLAGVVKEYYGLTELTQTRILSRCGQRDVPRPVTLSNLTSETEREALEGVLVKAPAMTVYGNQDLLRYGQLSVTTRWPDPADRARWLIDDPGSQTYPSDLAYLDRVVTTTQLYPGQRLDDFTAVLSYSFGDYRLIPLEHLQWRSAGIQRPERPDGTIRLAAANVNNLFNGDGKGRKFLNNRGAADASEYERQLRSVTQGLLQLRADVLVLNEIENDGFGVFSTVSDLLVALNRGQTDFEYRPVVFTAEQTGTSRIQNVILYNAKTAQPVSSPVSVLDWPGWQDRWHRPFLMQAFSINDNARTIAVIGAHLKSKGSGCPADTQSSVAQEGACTFERQQAAERLNLWLSESPDTAQVLLGDLNAHPDEAPVQMLLQTGWRSAPDLNQAYSYVYDGEPAVLDYALMRDVPSDAVVQAGYWNINSGAPWRPSSPDLPAALKGLQGPEYLGFSDHDPVFVDLRW